MLIQTLCKIFVPGINQPEKPAARAACGVFSGYVGVIVNVFLFAVKLTIGILSGSIAIAADAINNLSDAGSSAVTILGFKLAAKPADTEHPFGHGRIELCSGVVVAVIIMMMGFDFGKESISKIISPTEVHLSPLLMWLTAGTLLFKLWLFFFYRYIGKKINSAPISAAAFDSLSDMAGTTVVLLAVFASQFTAFPLDGAAGLLVAILVLTGGIKILKDTISPLLGEPPSAQFVEELQNRLLQCEGITGVHDIIIHNYGPNQYFATAHAEMEQHSDLVSTHDMLERAEVEIGKNMPVHLILHCDPYNPKDQEGKIWRVRLEDKVKEIDPHFKLYDFRLKHSGDSPHLYCHILIPRNYILSQEDIYKRLNTEMAKFSPAPELQIIFIHPYI